VLFVPQLSSQNMEWHSAVSNTLHYFSR